jgi:hypothetical protein
LERITYKQDYVLIYCEYLDAEGNRVRETEKRARLNPPTDSSDANWNLPRTTPKATDPDLTTAVDTNDADQETAADTNDADQETAVDTNDADPETASDMDFVTLDTWTDAQEQLDIDSDDDSFVTATDPSVANLADVSAEIYLEFDGSDLDTSFAETPLATTDPPRSFSVTEGSVVRNNFCPVCHQHVTRKTTRRHAESQHLPWWLSPQRACWSCHGTAQSATFLQYNHQDECAQVRMKDCDIPRYIEWCNGVIRTLMEALRCETEGELLQKVIKEKWYPQAFSPTPLSFPQNFTCGCGRNTTAERKLHSHN